MYSLFACETRVKSSQARFIEEANVTSDILHRGCNIHLVCLVYSCLWSDGYRQTSDSPLHKSQLSLHPCGVKGVEGNNRNLYGFHWSWPLLHINAKISETLLRSICGSLYHADQNCYDKIFTKKVGRNVTHIWW